MDSKKAQQMGVLVVLAAILLMIIPFAGLMLFPPLVTASLFFGLTAGLPMSELLFFVVVALLERQTGGRIFSLTEEANEDGKEVLVSSLEVVA